MTGRLQDRVAIVTGAGCVGPGWGNGRAAAFLFAQEGAKVFAVDRSTAAMEETLDRVRSAGGYIKPHICDVTESASVADMVAACRAEFGRIDILINNVGGSAAGGPVDLAEDAWDAQVDYNLKSVFLTCKHVLPVMEQQRAGVIINTSSTSGIRWTGAAQVAYAGRCTRLWWRRASPNSARVVTWKLCSSSAWRGFPSDSWGMGGIPPMRPYFWPPTRRVLLPAPRLLSTAA
jgi:NAD(P)-dependent dehydrogenase (short-subunit alcohol dehydrogenase family)